MVFLSFKYVNVFLITEMKQDIIPRYSKTGFQIIFHIKKEFFDRYISELYILGNLLIIFLI